MASLHDAETGDVSFLGSPKYAERLLPSRASVVLVPPAVDTPPPEGRAWVVCDDPAKAFDAVIEIFAPPPVEFPPGLHETAIVSDAAVVPATVHVGPHAVIEAEAAIGERTVIGAGCFVGRETRIGDDCLLYPHVVVRERCLLGSRVILHPGAVIGADGFGFEPSPQGHRKIPQVGIVQIDDDVEIGAQTTVDRARFGRTWIQRGTKIDNLVMVAHNVVLGQHCFVVSQVGISGSCRIGNGVILAGQAGLSGHLEVGDRAVLMAQSGLTRDVPPGAAMMGSPAVERREFARTQMRIKRLERLQQTVRSLEAQIEALEERLNDA
jgi:UDP-3-O-[3-hydroxymyristoyl] glucosamine N-acyltransferase